MVPKLDSYQDGGKMMEKRLDGNYTRLPRKVQDLTKEGKKPIKNFMANYIL